MIAGQLRTYAHVYEFHHIAFIEFHSLLLWTTGGHHLHSTNTYEWAWRMGCSHPLQKKSVPRLTTVLQNVGCTHATLDCQRPHLTYMTLPAGWIGVGQRPSMSKLQNDTYNLAWGIVPYSRQHAVPFPHITLHMKKNPWFLSKIIPAYQAGPNLYLKLTSLWSLL